MVACGFKVSGRVSRYAVGGRSLWGDMDVLPLSGSIGVLTALLGPVSGVPIRAGRGKSGRLVFLLLGIRKRVVVVEIVCVVVVCA